MISCTVKNAVSRVDDREPGAEFRLAPAPVPVLMKWSAPACKGHRARRSALPAAQGSRFESIDTHQRGCVSGYFLPIGVGISEPFPGLSSAARSKEPQLRLASALFSASRWAR